MEIAGWKHRVRVGSFYGVKSDSSFRPALLFRGLAPERDREGSKKTERESEKNRERPAIEGPVQAIKSKKGGTVLENPLALLA